MLLTQRLAWRRAAGRVRGKGGLKRAAGNRLSTRHLRLERLEQRHLLSGWLTYSDAGNPSDSGGRWGRDVALDSAGNVYVAGSFENFMNLVPTDQGQPISLESQGQYDAFVAKLNPEGKFLWARSMGGPGHDTAFRLAVSPAGEVYVGGEFSDTANFGRTSLTSAGDRDIFVVKLDTNGNFQWALRAGSAKIPTTETERERLTGIALGSDGVYVTGNYLGGADFGSSNLSSQGSTDVFLAKLTETADGPEFQWVQTVGTEGEDYSKALALGTSTSGQRIYLSIAEMRWTDAAARRLLEYSPEGNLLRNKKLSDPGTTGASMTVYQEGPTTYSIYLAIPLPTGPAQGASLAKLDPFPRENPEEIQELWRRSGGPGFWVEDLAADSTGVYATGQVGSWSLVDFDPDPDRSALVGSDNGYTGFVWKLDHGGNFLALRVTGESFRSDGSSAYSYAIALKDDAIYTTGGFQGPDAQFDVGTDFVQPTGAQGGYTNVFVLKTTQEMGGIFGRAFLDLNGNGTWDWDSVIGISEPPLPGFGVSAVADGSGQATAVTQKDGQFYFPHLTPGGYSVGLQLPEGWTQTTVGLGVTVEAGRFISSASSDFLGAYTPNEVSNYVSTDVPKKYPSRSWQTTTSTLTVSDSYPIFGVEISITVSGQPPLELSLIAPGGSGVLIPPEVYQANGTFTYATHAFNFDSAQGTFADAQGTWTLEIRNGNLGQTGKLTAWSLDIRHPSPPPSISINDVSHAEGISGTTAFNFTVTLSSAVDSDVTLYYATADGTALAGSDYEQTSGWLTIPAGNTSATITVLVYGDRLKEPDETFYVNLSNAVGAEIGDGQGVGTIRNDDKKTTASASPSALSSEPAQTDLDALAAAADQFFFELGRNPRKNNRQELTLDLMDLDPLLQP